MSNQPKLVGGPHDRKLVDSGRRINNRFWPPVLYFPHSLTLEESQALDIDGTIRWKNPEDVYERKDGDYVFRETVHYKP